MKQFRIEITGPRDKVGLIKCLRTFDNIGLKQAKDLVEEHISFERWMDDNVTFTMIVTAEQLGLRYAYQLEASYYGNYYIDDCKELKQAPSDINITAL